MFLQRAGGALRAGDKTFSNPKLCFMATDRDPYI
jgi:hypothetical protein